MESNSNFIELTTGRKNLDLISDIKFSKNNQYQLLIGTWGSNLLLYNCRSFTNYPHEPLPREPICELNVADTPLSILYPGNSNTNSQAPPIVGLLDGSVRQVDFENVKLGKNMGHTFEGEDVRNGINHLCQGVNNSVIASSFRGNLQLLDQRLQKPLNNWKNGRKVLTMESTEKYLILGLAGNVVEVYDLNKLGSSTAPAPLETREVGLKYQVTDIKASLDQSALAMSSIDGRVSIEYLDLSSESQQEKNFVFKSHRHFDKESGTDLVYPINSLAFRKHVSRSNLLFTAGSDGYLCLWDINKRKRLKQYPRFQTCEIDGLPSEEVTTESIAKIDVSHTDDLIAVATSDDNYKRRRRLSESENSRLPSRVYVKHLKN
ncbi:Bub3 protein [Candida orthopsilosis Co 90-125]|uniref:Bub3 protein n=1 Tax=Candida orthopsilosis (strain 90-125) TaxID=1136231 RepID=H8X7C2_CANO9|nr:Bub3 protein [Candida orthopsilosis Co 90-125]CCG24051.1 Bub3 protein [Candida orthopsilosis Co 90-125]